MSSLMAITDYLASIGCSFPDIGLLQPADPFLDTTGEDLRRRIFITTENSGAMLCLRPEFTIPVCLAHLQEGNGPARYAYGGSAFRQRRQEAAEFTQAGFEDLGNPDKRQADIDCINIALETVKAGGVNSPKLVLGNQFVFMTLLEALDIPAAWRKKLARSFGDIDLLNAQLAAMSQNGGSSLETLPDEIRKAIDGADGQAVEKAISERMLADGLPLIGGRTPAAIAARIVEKTQLGAMQLDAEKRAALDSFLQIDTGLDQAADSIAAFEKSHSLSLPHAAERLEAMNSGVSVNGADASFRASFGRRLDYYTGLVFEIYRTGLDKPVIGGGRYDRLLTLLGAEKEIPAVGFAIWVDRLGGAA
ncbi:MAG: ATP phosphoribosyltransferase regulatory subunit [Rhizobiaceae bacterium]